MTVPSLPKLGTPPAPAPLRKIALEKHFGHPIVSASSIAASLIAFRLPKRAVAGIDHVLPTAGVKNQIPSQ